MEFKVIDVCGIVLALQEPGEKLLVLLQYLLLQVFLLEFYGVLRIVRRVHPLIIVVGTLRVLILVPISIVLLVFAQMASRTIEWGVDG